jgi:hypothetical protein
MVRHLQSKSFTKKKRARFWWTLALVVIVIVTLISTVSLLSHLNALTIDDVKIFGAESDITDQLHSASERALSGSYLGIFSRSSTLMYPSSDIISAVKSASVRVDNVKVSRSGLHGLVVSVSEKVPSAVVCATLPDFQNNSFIFDDQSSCYFADDSGMLFERALAIPQSIYDLYYVPDMYDSTASSTDLSGSYATSTPEFVALQSFYDNAKSLGIAPDAILIKDGGEYEMYASSMVVYFNDLRSISDESSNLSAFWKTVKGPFDYIDLRYGSNVFYKAIK